jgi:hypothetical protein
VCEVGAGCSLIQLRSLAEQGKQFNIRYDADSMLATTLEHQLVMEVPVQRAKDVRSPTQRRLQHRIIFLVVGNQPYSILRMNQLREILESLRVLLDVERREGPDGL